MVRVARERIADLFALAEVESARGEKRLPNRYVGLARRVGTRYNVRLPAEYRELYCRRCSSYWVEGRTVRTRLRSGLRVRTCLECGSSWRVGVRRPRPRASFPRGGLPVDPPPEEPALLEESAESEGEGVGLGLEEEE